MKPQDLAPGPELDTIVAKEVMGWDVLSASGGFIDARYESKEAFKPFVSLIEHCGGLVAFRTREAIIGEWKKWSPSTEISAAWELLGYFMCLRIGPEKHPDAQHLPLKNCRHALYKPVVRLEFYEHDDIYRIELGRCKGVGGDDDIVFETNRWEEVPLLICRAALKAVGA